jgi:hypothetical protein
VCFREVYVVLGVGLTVVSDRQMFVAADAVGESGTRLAGSVVATIVQCIVNTPCTWPSYKHRAVAAAVDLVLNF